MNKETLKRDLCARLMEGVKVKDEDGNIGILTSISTNESYECVNIVCNEEIYMLHIEEIKPYLFPTSALTKPIRLANYNNGEPFVPIIKIKEETMWCDAYEEWWVMYQDMWVDDNEDDIHNYMIDNMKKAPFEVVELLQKFHINYRLSPDQFIEVTDENNPYV